jgi:hypothetical protein
MKAPTSKFGQFALGFVAELISFFIVVANARAYTHSNYAWTAITDILFSLQQFTMTRLMIDDPNGRTWWLGAGYTLGGTIGSLLAIFVTTLLGF